MRCGWRKVWEDRFLEGSRSISARGWLMLAQWTLFGTLGCIVVAVTINWLMFRDMGGAAVQRSIVSATLIPIVLAGPLFFYLTLKLRELAAANHRLAELAARDGLTGCLNRTSFAGLVDRRTASAAEGAGGALLVIDADHFKSINDRFGHDQGDDALRLIADAIRDAVRAGDLVGRLGGEEFAVFLPGAGHREAREVAERIRGGIAASQFNPPGGAHSLSASLGGAVFRGAADFQTLFRIADQRLYEAKTSGRNRVEITRSMLDGMACHAVH
jgi:diguanylate cyclase